MTPRKRFRPLLILPIAALVVMTLMVVPGNATLAKKYDLTVPTSVASGGSGTFVATYKNLSLYKLGSVELTIPNGFVKGTATTSKGTITQTATTVRVTNLNLSLLSTLKITVPATAPCGTPTGGSWTSVGKSTNDFSGSANFALNNPGNAQKATVTGSCSLAFVNQPDDTGVGDIINDPTGVSVKALDGASQPVSGVSIAMAANGPGPLSETSTTPVATAGSPATAAFTDLSVDEAGTYSLTASAAGFGPATSEDFVVAGAVLTCDEDGGTSYPPTSGAGADNVDLTRETGACETDIPITVVVRSTEEANEVEVQKPTVVGSAFTMEITWVVEDAVNPLPATQIDYFDDSGLHDMKFCLADDEDGNPGIPEDEFWCITDQTVELIGSSGKLQLTENYFGAGDPKFARNK